MAHPTHQIFFGAPPPPPSPGHAAVPGGMEEVKNEEELMAWRPEAPRPPEGLVSVGLPTVVSGTPTYEEDSKQRLLETLNGYLIHTLRSAQRPLSRSELTAAVRGSYDSLRKLDGTRYKGNLERAVTGALHSTGVFEKQDGGIWRLNEEKAKEYEAKVTKRFRDQARKRKSSTDGGPAPKKRRRPYTKRAERREAFVGLLSKVMSRHRAVGPDGSLDLMDNPLRALEGMTDELRIKRKLGDGRFVFLMQFFNYFEDLLLRGIGVDASASEGGTARAAAAADSRALAAQVRQLEGTVMELSERLATVEKLFTAAVSTPGMLPPALVGMGGVAAL
eukprot:PLAT12454.18.p1 GENE.PLAT12454.18~~PLAT12454.18.p1  ORF type:complete len:333 (+),score=101.87 PLAT12454.18:90-1088(+)